MELQQKRAIALFALIGALAFLTMGSVPTAVSGGGNRSNETNSTNTTQNCIDTDGGIMYYVFGQVYGYDAREMPFLYNDQCSGLATLWERYCVGNGAGSYPAVQPHECPCGCDGGKCVNNTNVTNVTC